MPSIAKSAAEIAAWKEADTLEDGLGGQQWQCIAVTLQEVREFLKSMDKTRDENEKVLRHQLELHLVPILERQEELQKRKQLQRERELLNLAKMANAKRSSRIADKAERLKQEEREKEEKMQRREAEATRRREERERLKLEKERDFRMFSRQRRLQEREARRLQHEEELAQLSEDSKRAYLSLGRISERRLLVEIKRNKQALEELQQDDWVFDCVCGLYGQVDDGTHSVACERCNTWQHSKCLGISEPEADHPEFHFVCISCQRRGKDNSGNPQSTPKLGLNLTDSCATESRPTGPPIDIALAPKAHAVSGDVATMQPAQACPEARIPPGVQPLASLPATLSDTPANPLAASECRAGERAGRFPQVSFEKSKSSQLDKATGTAVAQLPIPDAATSPLLRQRTTEMATDLQAKPTSPIVAVGMESRPVSQPCQVDRQDDKTGC